MCKLDTDAGRLGMYDIIGIKHEGIKSYWDLKGSFSFLFFSFPLGGIIVERNLHTRGRP